MVALGSCEKDESSDVWTVGSWVDNRSCSLRHTQSQCLSGFMSTLERRPYLGSCARDGSDYYTSSLTNGWMSPKHTRLSGAHLSRRDVTM